MDVSRTYPPLARCSVITDAAMLATDRNYVKGSRGEMI
jgi:hypothetical protein